MDSKVLSDRLELRRESAWVKRCIYNFLVNINGFKSNTLPLSVMELQENEMYHIKILQLHSRKSIDHYLSQCQFLKIVKFVACYHTWMRRE